MSLAFLPEHSHAATYEMFVPVARDTYVSLKHPDVTHGTDTMAKASTSADTRDILLSFEVPGGGKVTSATLMLYGMSDLPNHLAGFTTGAFTETTTWSTAPAADQFIAVTGPSREGVQKLAMLPSAVKPGTTLNLRIKGGTSKSMGNTYMTREAGTPAKLLLKIDDPTRPLPPPPSSVQPVTTWTKMLVHPQASRQRTARGRSIHVLKAWRGRIYAGFGDYDVNTGPIALTGYDPIHNSFDEFPSLVLRSEQIDNIRELGGNLFVPAIDPTGTVNIGRAIVQPDGSPTWESLPIANLIHVYDAVEFEGATWVVGAKGTKAVVYRSVDHGLTWQLMLSKAPLHSGSWARYYFAGVFRGKLYVQASDLYGGTHPTSQVFSEGSWSAGPWLASRGHKPESFAGQLIYLDDPTYSSRLMSFDGAVARAVGPGPLKDFAIDSSRRVPRLIVLADNNDIYETTDLRQFNRIGTAPTVAHSIIATGSTLFVGGVDSAIYRLG